MLESVEDEKARAKKLWDSEEFTALREQMEKDFKFLGPYKFTMPKEEGKWNNVSTNSPKVLMNKVIGLLSASWAQVYIPVSEEDRKEREDVSATEKVANGCIYQADRNLTQKPSGKTTQDSLSTYAPLRGGVASSVLLYEDGGLKSDIKSYDPFQILWIEGTDGLFWFGHWYYESIDYLKEKYGEKFEFVASGEHSGEVYCLFVWRKDEWGLIAGDQYVEKEKNHLGYIPVKIAACGAMPIIQSKDYTDTMKYSWLTAFTNNRDIYDLESQLLSIESSKAIESGKIKIYGEWDSTQGEQPEGIKKFGYSSGSRNEAVLFDSAKGQKWGGMVEPPSNDMIERILGQVMAMDMIGSVDPVAWGQLRKSGVSGTLAAELRSAALEFLSPFQKTIENTLVWIAEESVKQYANNDFEKASFQGKDYKRNKYQTDISPKDIKDTYNFECELVIDRLRDETMELGNAVTKVTYGLSSRKTAMLQGKIVEDPDIEMDAIDEEIANQDPVFRFDKIGKKFADLGTPEGDRRALYYQKMSDIFIERVITEGILPGEGRKPAPGNTAQAQTAKVAAEPLGG